MIASAGSAHAAGAVSIKSIETIPVDPNVKVPDDQPQPYPKLKIKVGTGATGLKPADFMVKVAEGDKPVGIPGEGVVPFKDSDEELDIFILVQGTVRFMGDPNPEPAPGEDNTPIPGYYNEAKAAIDTIAHARAKKTNVGLFVYGEKTITKVPLGPAANVSGDSLGIQKDFAKITTKAMQKGLQYAVTTLSNAPGRRVLFIIGDGEDQDANVNINDEVKHLSDSSIEVYVLGANPRGNIEPKEAARLGKLGKLGDYLVANQAEQIQQVAETLANEVNNVYTVTFPGIANDGSVLPWDGEEHDITVQAKKDESEAKSYRLLMVKKVAPPPPGGGFPIWLAVLLGLVGVLAIAVVAMVLLKKPQEEEMVDEAPMPMPMPMPMAPAPPPPAAPVKTMMIGVGGGEDGMPVVGWIVPLSGPNQYQTFKLSSRTVIGKNPDANVVIEDAFMSGQHAEIVMSNAGFTIMDKGSANGVLVNSKRVPTHDLVDNDVFTLGKTDFKFKSIN
jgi:hypothetical protein